MTEGYMPGNEMCNYWMQGHMYGKKQKVLAIVGTDAGLPMLLVY